MLGKNNSNHVINGEKAVMVRDMAIRSARHSLLRKRRELKETPLVSENKNIRITW